MENQDLTRLRQNGAESRKRLLIDLVCGSRLASSCYCTYYRLYQSTNSPAPTILTPWESGTRRVVGQRGQRNSSDSRLKTQVSMLNAQCSMLHAQCSMLNAQDSRLAFSPREPHPPSPIPVNKNEGQYETFWLVRYLRYLMIHHT